MPGLLLPQRSNLYSRLCRRFKVCLRLYLRVNFVQLLLPVFWRVPDGMPRKVITKFQHFSLFYFVICFIGCMTEFCSCRDIDSNPNYVDCEDQFQQIYLVCIGSCAHGDFACLAVCNRDYESSVKDCPCQENCPNGCPCPSYTCQGNGFHTTDPSLKL